MIAIGRVSLLICFLLVVKTAYPQDYARINKLKEQLKKTSGVEKTSLLNRLAFEFRNSFPDSSIYFAGQTIAIASAAGQENFMAEALNIIGLAYSYKGNRANAFHNYTKALEYAQRSRDSLQLAYSFNNLGRLFLEGANAAQAYEYFAKARVIFTLRKDNEGLAYVYRSLSDLFQSQGDYSNALQMAEQALQIRRLLKDNRSIVSALIQTGKVYQLAKDYSQAETALREAETIASEQEDEASLTEIKLGLGELYFANGSYSKSKSEAFRAQTMVERLESKLLISRCDLLIGQIFLKEKNYQEALPFFQRAVKLSESQGQLQILTEAAFYLAKWYGLQGMADVANQWEEKYKLLNDSLKNNELVLLAESFNFQLEIEEGTRKNELLEAKEAENEATIKLQRLVNISAGVVIILASIFTFLLWRSSRMRKRINAKLATRNQQLDELNREKDSLMGIVAHDLKSPLSNIRTITDLVPTMGALNPKQTQFIGLIKSSSDEGLNLIGELLDAHTLETVQKLPTLQKVDSISFIQQRIDFFTSTAAAKLIKIENLSEAACELHTDPGWLARCIDNLLSNALKFSPKESVITVSSGTNENVFWLSVKDQGPGFSEEDKKKLYEKFTRLSARPTGGESSNGLGLNIVKTLVGRMHGTITLLSEKGKGSEFIIQFPV